jgi:hypothetical protein
MNRDWMRERLEDYKILCDAYDLEDQRSRGVQTPRKRELTSEFNAVIPTVREIVKRLDLELVENITVPMYTSGTSHARQAAEQALGILRDQDEWKANLAPDAPSLVADQFHPNVWKAASAIWDTGQYRVAVQQSAVSLSAHIAAKAVSSLTERALVKQVFSPEEPRNGQQRLHMPGDKTSQTWKSRQEGLHLMAQGAFAGIRNVATHTGDEWPEQVALEHLAVLSVVARWTDETELVKLGASATRSASSWCARAR